MKHFALSIIVLVGMFSLFSIGFAQETNLGDIIVRFCNDEQASSQGGTKSLYMEAETGEEHDICMYLSNAGDLPVTVKLNFVDGTVTNDIEQKKACQPENVKGKFGKFVTIEESEVPLNPGETKEVHANVMFPGGYAGMSYGCVTSQIMGQSESGEGMFKILSRRANFIDVLVAGEIVLGLDIVNPQSTQLKNRSSNEQIFIFKDPVTKAWKAKIEVRNPGNVAQEVTITPTVNTWFSSKKELTQAQKKVLPGQKASFEFELNDGIPVWRGIATVNIALEHQAAFEFNSDEITDEMREPKMMDIKANFFLVPWLLLVILGGACFIVYIVKTKKIVIKVGTQ